MQNREELEKQTYMVLYEKIQEDDEKLSVQEKENATKKNTLVQENQKDPVKKTA